MTAKPDVDGHPLDVVACRRTQDRPEQGRTAGAQRRCPSGADGGRDIQAR